MHPVTGLRERLHTAEAILISIELECKRINLAAAIARVLLRH